MAMNDEFKLQLIGATIQWQRGPLTGRLNKIANIKTEGAFEYVFFEDGTKEMSIKFPDWFIPIDDEASAPIPIVRDADPGPDATAEQFANETDIKKIDPTLKANSQYAAQEPMRIVMPQEADPLIVLLNKQKREEREVTFKVKLNVPKPGSMKILRESFDGFDESLVNWIKSDPEIINSVIEEIKNTLID